LKTTALLGDGIRAGLKLADYAVDWVRDGEAARLALLDHAYQACVLDLGLPKRDGLSVLEGSARSAATICRC
jgi:DNA-binding response OmpR family regulator